MTKLLICTRLSIIITYSVRIVNKYSLFLYRNMILWVYAAIAQLVERIHGKDEVTGSNPVRGSIKNVLESSSGNDKRL